MTTVAAPVHTAGTMPRDCNIPAPVKAVCAASHAETVHELSDAVLEAKIVTAGLQVRLYQRMLDEAGCDQMGIAGDRDYYRQQMDTLISQRRPEQVRRMELARSLASGGRE